MSKLGSAEVRLVFNDKDGFVVYHGATSQVLLTVPPENVQKSDWEEVWSAFRKVEANAYHRSPEGKALDRASAERVDELRQAEASTILSRAMKRGSFPWQGELADYMTKVSRSNRVVTAMLLALQAVDIRESAVDELIANFHMGKNDSGEVVVISWTSGSFGYQYLVVSKHIGNMAGDESWPIYVNLRDGLMGCWQLKRIKLTNVDD